MLAGMDCFEAMLSPRPDPACRAWLPDGAHANTKAPAGRGPGSCPWISRKEQSLWPHPPILNPASSWLSTLPPPPGEGKEGGEIRFNQMAQPFFSSAPVEPGAGVGQRSGRNADQDRLWLRAKDLGLGSNTALVGTGGCDPRQRHSLSEAQMPPLKMQ